MFNMLFSRKSFKNKIKQDFSELLKFLDTGILNNSSNQSNKYLTFGEKLAFNSNNKKKKTFNVPHFDSYLNVKPDLLMEYYVKNMLYYITVFRISRIFLLLVLCFFFFFVRKYYKFIFSTYTFYFLDHLYDLEDLLFYFKNFFK